MGRLPDSPQNTGGTRLYAAYGSNMDPKQMAMRAPHSPVQGVGWLQGWRLTFCGEGARGEGALASIVEEPDHQVFVVLYDVPEWDEASLDQWEGASRGVYHKVRLRVQTLDGEVLAWFYVLDSYEGGLPSASYLGSLADAAEMAGAPDDYVKNLRGRPCKSDGT
ncbi:gamma-glutamylcyclotransferase [Nonomuraea africana]|uniref:gamma-glutamylcyclotransferase n=1 Tax=Nonomuraea africana TaxID=46171 RepID=UPI0033ED1C4E